MNQVPPLEQVLKSFDGLAASVHQLDAIHMHGSIPHIITWRTFPTKTLVFDQLMVYTALFLGEEMVHQGDGLMVNQDCQGSLS